MVFICLRCYKEFDSVPHIRDHMNAEICNMKVLSLLNTKEQLEISSIPRDNKLDNKVILHQTMLKVPNNVEDFHEKYKKVKAIYMLKEFSKMKEEDEEEKRKRREEKRKRMEEENKRRIEEEKRRREKEKEEEEERRKREESVTSKDILNALNYLQREAREKKDRKKVKRENKGSQQTGSSDEDIKNIRRVMEGRYISDEESEEEIEIDKNQCDYCLKVFNSKSHLKRHIKESCEFYKMREEIERVSKEEDLEKEFKKMENINPQFLENFKYKRIAVEDRKPKEEETLFDIELRKIKDKNRKRESRKKPQDQDNFYIITNKNKEEFKGRLLKREDGTEYVEKERFQLEMLKKIQESEDKDLIQYGLGPGHIKEDRLRGFDECMDLSHLNKETIRDILVSTPKIENLILKSIENKNNHGVYVFNPSIVDNIVYIKKLYNESTVHNNVLIMMPRDLIIKELYDQCKFVLHYLLLKETKGKENIDIDERLRDVKRIEDEIKEDYERLKKDIKTHKLIFKQIHCELGGMKFSSLEEMMKSVSNLTVFQNMGRQKDGKSMPLSSVKIEVDKVNDYQK